MADDQVRQFIEQATQSLQGGQIAQALELSEQAVLLNPDNADAHLLKAIALSQSNQPQAATDAFRRAIFLAPHNAKAQFNFAVHLYSRGYKEDALTAAQEAVSIDPTHSGARELAIRIESEAGLQPTATFPKDFPTPQSTAATPPPLGQFPPQNPGPATPFQTGYEARPVHTLKFVENLAGNWIRFGWALVVLQVGALLAMVVVALPQLTDFGPRSIQAISEQTSLLSAVWTILSLVSLLWVIFDLSDRRGNFIWLLPQILCGCTGCGFIVLPLYILAGRK